MIADRASRAAFFLGSQHFVALTGHKARRALAHRLRPETDCPRGLSAALLTRLGGAQASSAGGESDHYQRGKD